MPEVAAARTTKMAELWWRGTLRLTIYVHALVLIPLWLGRPANSQITLWRQLRPGGWSASLAVVAAALWGTSSIVISRLASFGIPC